MMYHTFAFSFANDTKVCAWACAPTCYGRPDSHGKRHQTEHGPEALQGSLRPEKVKYYRPDEGDEATIAYAQNDDNGKQHPEGARQWDAGRHDTDDQERRLLQKQH